MTEADISAEKRITTDLGCEIVAWDANSLVIAYHEDAQRTQLINAFNTLGWNYPVNDPQDEQARVLELKREPEQRIVPSLLMESGRTGRIVLWSFTFVVVIFCVWDVARDVTNGHIVQALISGLTYLLILALVLYSSLPYVTLKVWLNPQEIILANFVERIALKVSDIKSCTIQTYQSRDGLFFTILFTMQNGQIHKMPAPFNGFQNFKDELRRRYTFKVYP